MQKTENNAGLYQALNTEKRAADISAEAGCILPPGYRLLRFDDLASQNRNEYEIALLNDLEASVVYYNQVVTAESMAEQKVWRSSDAHHSAVLKDIPDKVFFDYILQRHRVMLSDDERSGEGRHHWQRQLSHALKRGMKVDYYQTENQLQPVADQEALNDLVDKLWSATREQSSSMALISRANASHA